MPTVRHGVGEARHAGRCNVNTKRARALLAIDPIDDGRRCVISSAKEPFLNAIRTVMEDNRNYWPLTVRQIHYRLLALAPLKHAEKSESRYVNNVACYKSLVELMTRARTEGLLPWDAIDDPTRLTKKDRRFSDKAEFLTFELAVILQGYHRDRMQTQSAHIEVLVEKDAVLNIVGPVCEEFCLALTSTRGAASISAKHEVAQRFAASGKKKLVLLVASDLDPMGDVIAEDLVKTMRRDFGIAKEIVTAHKVAMTMEQVREYDLPPNATAKKTSSTYYAYVEEYQTTGAWELEAFTPEQLAAVLREAIESVIDKDEYLAQTDAEDQDREEIADMREHALRILRAEFSL